MKNNRESGWDEQLTLQDLITTLKGDRSYRELETASGGVVKSQRWNQLANGQRVTEFPGPETLNAIGAALPCDPEVLLLAVARTVGYELGQRYSRFADMLPPSIDDMSEASKSALLTMARALSETDAAVNTPQPAPKKVSAKKNPKPRARRDIPPLA